ncbi:A49-like RNA polymerase I associated factor [Ancylostoma duodenale]|uniref:A49-like RNA polymerase I associated factor n=1 Tax=Ancylostoma duodenale TaxID=51022 RepID=A0A0C2GBM3_9BILA|nr:A49-like RNA polymerase I associated factor [Ancylostoma duodenale]
MEKTDVERRRNERERMKRKSTIGRGDHDIVAVFSHNRVVNPDQLRFREHKPIDGRRGETLFTVENDVCEHVVEVGTEVTSLDEGYDYVVAIVDREAGTTNYRPVRLYNFEATYSSDMRQLLGENKFCCSRRRAPIDYGASYDIKTEDWAKRRMDLTADFGSSKKMKIQEAAVRRQINNETLDAMRKTAFASTSVLAEPEDIKVEQISLVAKAESSILPHAEQAELPRNIYPVSLFISQDEIAQFADSALEFLATPKKELLEKDRRCLGFPEVVMKMLPMTASKDASLAVPFILLGCMTYMSALFSRKSILKKEFEAIPFPEVFVQKVMGEFISEFMLFRMISKDFDCLPFPAAQFDRGVNGRMAARLAVSSLEKDKLVAHLLALGLTLSGFLLLF